jgi:hypothetical protein
MLSAYLSVCLFIPVSLLGNGSIKEFLYVSFSRLYSSYQKEMGY